MGLNNYNLYGISSETDNWSEFRTKLFNRDDSGRRRSSSFSSVPKTCSIDDIMQEFRLNGLDSPYDPDEVIPQVNRDPLIGMGPSSHYLRQTSWPAPEATPSVRLPRLTTELLGSVQAPTNTYQDIITEQQLRVLSSLPNDILYSLLRELELTRGEKKRKMEDMECKFCKNNGERASYYRSHRLRARGRLACPVLRAYRCRRCGAHGDRAHTIKYCPLASDDERMKSAAMMRSVRLASGRRRSYVDNENVSEEAFATELDPIWEALEKKLML